MTKLTAVLMFLLFANASAGKISSVPEQDVEGKLGRSSLFFRLAICVRAPFPSNF